MVTSLSQPRWQRADGSALIAAAIAAAVLGIMVISYLTWVTNEYRLSKRSHAWSQALNLCEAGAELALAEFNSYYANNPNSAFKPARGWTSNSTTTVAIQTVSNFVNSTGQTVGNVSITVSNIGSKFASVQCAASVSAQSKTPVNRNLLITLKKRPGFKYALVSRLPLVLNSSLSLVVDSFNSSKITESTGGQYDVTKRTPRGNVSSLDASTNSITLKGVSVYGEAATAPGGHISFQSGSSLGQTFNIAQRTGSEATSEAAGWETHDFIFDMPSVVLPDELLVAPSLGNIKGPVTLPAGDYRVGDLKNTSGDIIIDGNVRIYVTGQLLLSGSSQLKVKNNTTLQIYAAGTVTFGGNGLVNETLMAENVTLMGLSTSTTWNLSGSFNFTGTVYAPQAALILDGSADFTGAFVANTITMGSSTQVHYDEALGIASGKRGYTVLSWQPLVNRNGAWVIETN